MKSWLSMYFLATLSASKRAGEGPLKDGLAEAGGALEVGGHHRLQLLHHAQPPLHFRHDPLLFGEGGTAT